ncbi:MAG: hypothetical protein J6I97_03430, partial [Agathobacter sp.]|nr:hypothetical protein [Agathobacter sp.]
EASQVTLYGLSRMADLESITVSNNSATINGKSMKDLDQLNIYAVDENQDAWLLAEADVATIGNTSATVAIEYPANLPTGRYTIKAVGVVKDENGNGVANPMVETTLDFENPNQPAAPTKVTTALGGDYSIDVTPTAGGDFTGYSVTIYEQTGTILNTKLTPTIYENLMMSKNTSILTVGGQYQVPVMDEKGNPTEQTKIVGLEADKKYVVGVSTYKTLDDGSVIFSEETRSAAITMVASEDVELTFDIEGSVAIETAGVKIDTIGAEDVTVLITGADTVKNGSYTLNDGEKQEWTGGNISLTDLENGVYLLSVVGENANGDSFGAKYQFAIDVKEPRLMISSPQNGFFRGEKQIITGLSEAGSKVTAMVKRDSVLGRTSTESVTVTTGEDGRFLMEVPMDMGVYQQTIQLYSVDEVGNKSRTVNLILVNGLVGSEDTEAILLADGEETKEILANGEDVQLEMAFKVDNQVIRLNDSSMAAALVNYELTIYEGSAEVDAEGIFNGTTDTVGMVRATLEEYEVAARIVGASLADATVTLTLPEGGYTYDEAAKEPPVASVVLNGVTLVEGEDYTVSYTNNIAAGTGTVLIEAVPG